eukprot:3719379-Prymnesium_polylepis.1
MKATSPWASLPLFASSSAGQTPEQDRGSELACAWQQHQERTGLSVRRSLRAYGMATLVPALLRAADAWILGAFTSFPGSTLTPRKAGPWPTVPVGKPTCERR